MVQYATINSPILRSQNVTYYCSCLLINFFLIFDRSEWGLICDLKTTSLQLIIFCSRGPKSSKVIGCFYVNALYTELFISIKSHETPLASSLYSSIFMRISNVYGCIARWCIIQNEIRSALCRDCVDTSHANVEKAAIQMILYYCFSVIVRCSTILPVLTFFFLKLISFSRLCL